MSTAERNLPTPVFAVVGAGDVAVQEVKDALAELRTRADERRERTQNRIQSTRTRISELPNEVPSVDELRGKLTSEELRKLADPYIEATTGFYNNLAERGQTAVARLRENALVSDNLNRVEKAYNDAVDLTEDALGVVSTQTRTVGERAAGLVGRAAEGVDEAAGDLADASTKVEKAATTVKAESATAANKVAGAAGTVEAKARTSASSPAKKVDEAKKATPAKSTAAKAPARKPAAKKAPAAK
ncbi:heparin-binding hemagglutinin [Gordonia zhaorongruii]|uniref:heparin-binding hemagglutinin n=1 Tax=Gordonia zhaorongruii TaxID=2597659 RepID=UPI0010443391|nr:heparin-binding hemagglutinin [Gordonia zhaorongruii]